VRVAFRLPEHLRERHEANRGVTVRRWSGNSRATPFPNFHTEPAYLVPWKKRSVTYPMGYQVTRARLLLSRFHCRVPTRG
jgi:hypothetical protein